MTTVTSGSVGASFRNLWKAAIAVFESPALRAAWPSWICALASFGDSAATRLYVSSCLVVSCVYCWYSDCVWLPPAVLRTLVIGLSRPVVVVNALPIPVVPDGSSP